MVGAAILLQALERLALLSGLDQQPRRWVSSTSWRWRSCAGGLVGALGTLQVGLARHHLGGAHGQSAVVHLRGASVREAIGGGLHLLLATLVAHDRAGQSCLAASS